MRESDLFSSLGGCGTVVAFWQVAPELSSWADAWQAQLARHLRCALSFRLALQIRRLPEMQIRESQYDAHHLYARIHGVWDQTLLRRLVFRSRY